MNKRFLLAAFVASVSFCSFAEELDHWLVDTSANTMSDGVWTFAVTIDTKNNKFTVGACVPETGFPAELSTLDLSKTVKDASEKTYTITSLGTLFGTCINYWKDASTTTGLTLGKAILPTTITSIGAGAFAACASLTNVVNFLPDSVTTLGDACFFKTAIRDDLYAYGVTSFGRNNFYNLPIRSVHFGKNLTTIGNGSNGQAAFQGCCSLTNLVFHPEGKGVDVQKSGIASTTAAGTAFKLRLYGVSVVGDSGFEGVKTSEVVFDRGIRLISSTDAFKNCQFQKVTFLGAPPASWKVIYSGVNSKVTTYVPAAYRAEWETLTAGPIPDDGETTFSAAVCSAAGISDVSKRPVKLIPGSLPVEIGTAAAFVSQLNAQSNSYIKLTADIDLTGSGYTTLPRFEGFLDGQGHTISGVGAQPLFDWVRGEIRNLTLDGTVSGAKTVIPFAAADVKGAMCNTLSIGTIKNCRIKGYKIRAPSTASTCWVGLFAGRAYNDSLIEGCETDESCELYVSNNGYGGGFVAAATVSGSPAHGPSFIDCTNRAVCAYSQDIYSGGGLGTIVGNASAGTRPMEIRGCVNYADISSEGFKGLIIGGIAGTGSSSDNGVFVVADCVNYGSITVRHKQGGFILGGIFGSVGLVTMTNCVNYGDIAIVSNSTTVVGSGDCGGLCGKLATISKLPSGSGGATAYFINCANYGDVSSSVLNAGGLFGKITLNNDYGSYMNCRNCANYGVLDGIYVGEASPLLYDEKKQYIGKAMSRYTVQNCFFRTATLHYPWTADNGWCAESGNVTAEDVGYNAQTAATTLSTVALENGWSKWRVDSLPYPELVSIIGDVVVKRGLAIFFR